MEALQSALCDGVDPFVDIAKVDTQITTTVYIEVETLDGECGVSGAKNRGHDLVKAEICFWDFRFCDAEVECENRAPKMRPPLGKNAGGNGVFGWEKRENVAQNFIR